MNVSRRLPNGSYDDKEVLNKSQIYVKFFGQKFTILWLKFLYYSRKMKKGILNQMYYIYKIENLINHKKYIGLTNNIKRRSCRHFGDLKRGVHDNHFLQKEYNIYGKENFSINIEYKADCSSKEISQKEKEYIKKYDSYKNGYNQNEGGNFEPSNGGSKLTQTDIFNILSCLEFMSKPGQVLADIFEVSRTTISRIKRGESHVQYKEEYDKMSYEERRNIYEIFCQRTNFLEEKFNSTIIQSKRKLTEEQVHLILLNFERRIITNVEMAKRVNIKSTYTLDCIKNGLSYKDFSYSYSKLSPIQKDNLASLLSN